MALQTSIASEPVDTSRHLRRIQTLDGLRAIAILLVICDHYTPRVVAAGGQFRRLLLEAANWAGCGVDLFFVLSGFLITGILLDAKGSANYFRRFYWRRSLRIFPAFYSLLIFAVFAQPGLFRNIRFFWFALYLRNWVGADNVSDGTLGHLWSLAVEEQFYIAWSLVVFLCPRRYLTRIMLMLIAAAPVVRAFMHYFGYAGYLIFRVTPARMDSLLFGALVAVAIRSGWTFRGNWLARAGLWTGAAGLVVLRLFLGPLTIDVSGYQIAFPSLIALSFASLVFLCIHLPEKALAYRLLACYPFRILAKYSYAIYLWHLFAAGTVAIALEILREWLPWTLYWRAPAFFLLAFCVSLTIASLSWRLIEAPVLNLKDRYLSSVQR